VTVHIGSIVEGYGDRTALPLIVRKIAHNLGVFDIDIRTPHRLNRSDMTTPKVGAAARIQRAGIGVDGFVIVLYDSDDDDPETTETATRKIISEAGEDAIVCVAVREFEAWFLAGISSLRGAASVRDDASFDGDPESPRDAKGRLEDAMTETYKETLHQARFAAQLDLDLAAGRSPSLRRFIELVSDQLRCHS